MRHQLIFLGKTKERFIADGVSEYAARLGHYTTFGITTLREKGARRNRATTVIAQGEQLLQAVSPGDFVVVLDVRGIQFSSPALAAKIEQLEQGGIRQVSYLIGGPEGHGDVVLARADLLLSLSKMTLTHDMARLLLIEQLYRAYTIKAGEQYHK